MRLPSGVRLGPYEILSLVGAGGMGEVYRARDTRLDRTVAIKVLPSDFAADAESRARLHQEARAIGALNHPNICVLHDIGHTDGVDYLVLEYLEGESLADRLGRTKQPLTIDEAVSIAAQVADALDRAHRAAIVHRDLKPANMFLTRGAGGQPTAKLLDFGLAKTQRPSASVSVAVTAAQTERGTVLGTYHYMSPEQVHGRDADLRSDVFSFGVVLYEMVTGRKAFPAGSVAGVMSAVLRDTPPPPSSTQPLAPPAIDWVVQRCLEKDPDDRWQSMRDVAHVLREAPRGASSPVPAAVPVARRGTWAIAAGAMAVALFAGGYVVRSARGTPAVRSATPIRLSIVAPDGTTFTPRDITLSPQFTMSPDGTRVAFVASATGDRPQVWVRSLDSTVAQVIAGTEDATGPFWSPDGRSLGFFARRKLKVVPLAGGVPRDLADVAYDVTGGVWTDDGTIVFTGATGTALLKVGSGGGPVSAATRLDESRKEMGHRWPQFLPDGRRFLFFSRSAQPANSGVYVGSLDSPAVTQVAQSMTNAVYVPSGSVLFDRGGTLMSQPFDAASGQTHGEPSALEDRVVGLLGPSLLPISVARNGTLAYWAGERPLSHLQWFDRSGKPGESVGDAKKYVNPRLSPDGRRVLVTVRETRPSMKDDLWSLTPGGSTSRLTVSSGPANFGIWSPDGRDVIHSQNEKGVYRIFQKSANGIGDERQRTELANSWALFPNDWSADGRWLVYTTNGDSAWDLWTLDLTNETSKALVVTPSNEAQARVSADGRFMTYASDESGRWEVYVTTFPSASAKWQVSTDGGSQPQWRGDGKELFFLARDGRLMAVSVSGGDALEFGAPQPLFQTSLSQVLSPFIADYAVSRDGQRFLVNSYVPDAAPQTITVVLNWSARPTKEER